MKRKAIQLAGNSLVISLPKKWTTKHQVKKGDELEVIEQGTQLIINTKPKSSNKIAVLNMDGLSARAAVYLLSSAHHKGVDEMQIKNVSAEVKTVVKTLLRDAFVGFILMKETPKELVIRSVAVSNPEEFHATLRRAFLVTLTMGQSLVQTENRGEVIEMEKTNNQLVLFCQRAIRKNGIRGEDDVFLYLIPYNVNRIGDSYRDIALCTEKKKLTKEEREFLEKVNKFFYEYYEAFYEYSMERVEKLGKERDMLLREGTALMKKGDGSIVMHALEIVKRVASMMTSLISLKEEF